MGYKVLGFLVWHGGRLYISRRSSGVAAKAAIAGLGAAVVAGVILVGRKAAGGHDA
jgi:hypothetical protein